MTQKLGEIPILLPNPELWLDSCRQQLAAFDHHTHKTITAIEHQLQHPHLLPQTRTRCLATLTAIRDQAADIHAILDPVLGKPNSSTTPPTTGPSTLLTYIHYLYRDWGWPADPTGENERIFDAVQTVRDNHPLGRLLVLGAGACRLAYDLHRSDPQNETTVIDLDPLLFTAAHTIIRGGTVTIREVNVEIGEIKTGISKTWVLKAEKTDRLHFFFADGLAPPFEPESFDTILTPWFIDIVPTDLRDLMGTIHRLLRPGGRWLNIGPLHYRPEVPVSRRFTREEIFELAERAGFRMAGWKAESMPYLVSKLNGRGKIEWVLAFSATRGETPKAGWEIFGHVPVPVFEGLRDFKSDDPAEQLVASAIDGKNTVDDIAGVLAAAAGETGLTRDQLREIVRRCLSER